VLTNSSMYDYAPEVLDAFRARGDEILAHGRTNSERQVFFQKKIRKKTVFLGVLLFRSFFLSPWSFSVSVL